jgi:uncharacterized repeat protein (TIGR03843 family)
MGSVQLFIPHDPDANYFTFGPEAKPQLQRIVLFDSLVNNADRKGGHCLLDSRGFIWAIDHGICFHTQAKLRTVIWDFAGQAIPAALLKDVEALCDILKGGQPGIIGELSQYLSSAELQALQRRLSALIEAATYPRPDGGRSYPWPPV